MKEVNNISNNNENVILYCEEHNSGNNYIYIFSEKYNKWLTTRNKSKNTCLKSAESAYQNCLDRRNKIIQDRVKYLEYINKKFNLDLKYKNYENDSCGLVSNVICTKCKESFSIRFDHFKERFDFENGKIKCSSCIRLNSNKIGAKARSGPGICSHCGKYVESRDSSCLCKECRGKKSRKDRKDNEKAGYCKICGTWNEVRNNVGLGKSECNCSDLMYSQRGMKIKYCDNCKQDTLHNEGICLSCNPNAKAGGGIVYRECINGKDHKCLHISGKCSICENIDIGFKPNFITKNSVRFYKDKELNQLVQDLINKVENINNYPGFEIRCNRVYFNDRDILTDESIYLINNFNIVDNVKYVLDKSIGQYVHWENFKNNIVKKFNSIKDNKNIMNTETMKFINNENFSLEAIFNIDKDFWSKSQTDEYLSEKGYKWIVYIKFFKNLPFIVGKTGTTNVIPSGIDFDFIVGDKNDKTRNGQGRQFIRENFPEYIGGCTDHEFILVKNFEDEAEALEFEDYIQKKYNLFGS